MLGGPSGGTGPVAMEEEEERDFDPELKEFWIKALEGGGATKGAAFWDRQLSASNDAAVAGSQGGQAGGAGEEDDDDDDEEEGRDESLPHCE